MFHTTQLLSAVTAALACSSAAIAAPWDTASKHSTHRTREISPSLKLETYHPPSTYKTFGKGAEDAHAARVKRDGIEAAATSYQLSLDDAAVKFRSGYASGSSVHYGYIRQTHENVPFVNAVANVAFKDDKVVSFGHSFVQTDSIAASTPSVELDVFLSDIEKQLGGKFNDHASVEYLVKSDGSIALVHVVQIQNQAKNTWYEAMVDAHNGELLSITDFTAHASYKVLPVTKVVPTEGFETVKDPANKVASPYGWHGWSDDSQENSTTGNNVMAFKGQWNTGQAVQSADGLVFDYTYDLDKEPGDGDNTNAAVVNAFYLLNTLHDVSYIYGFTEDAYNFQWSNFDKGGANGDRVMMNVQSDLSTDNAGFTTPPDGQAGQCYMFLWDYTTPHRDGDMENDLPLHEGTHGISNRLTGGGTARCLQTNEAGGMGEGWSDAMAEWMQQTSGDVKDFIMGSWVSGNSSGYRSHPYSTDPKVNPLRYSSVKELEEVHDIGEVWANVLHNVYAALVEGFGWDADFKTNADSEKGNVVFMHLFIDSLALQPCNPTMVQSRDAWIQADENRYDGAHACSVWKAFASRGFGVNAADFNDDETVPKECQ
ncbi:Fungalysin metallopeptidase-domain-containing protein [Schizophyllum fasciatum]